MYYTILLFLFSYKLVNDKIEESKNVQTADVIRKMNWEEKHKFDLAKEWRDNLIATSITSQSQLEGTLDYIIFLFIIIIYMSLGRTISGFVRRTVLEQDFVMILHSQQQLDCVKLLPTQYRILRMDSTVNLMHVSSKKRKYPRILPQFMQLKDLREIGNNVEIINSFLT